MRTSDFAQIQSLRGSFKGQVGWLIGNGPSVRTEDLDQIVGQCGFCCNRFYMAYDQMKFRPNFTVSCDKQVVEDFGRDIISNSEGTVVFSTHQNYNLEGSVWLPSIDNGSELMFNEKTLANITPAGGTLFTAIQLGYFLGIRKFYLYGVDHNFKFESVENQDSYRTAQGEDNHFIKDYRSGKKWSPPVMGLVEEAFTKADLFLRKEGGFVVNATRGGKLEVLQRLEFEDALLESRKTVSGNSAKVSSAEG